MIKTENAAACVRKVRRLNVVIWASFNKIEDAGWLDATKMKG